MSVGVIKDGQYVKCAPSEKDYYIDSSGAYHVYTAEGLLAWAAACESDKTVSCHLMNDIDLEGVEWTPIGTSGSSNRYNGHFYGNGHAVMNLTQDIERTDNVSATAGFLGYVGANGIVENLILSNVDLCVKSSNASVYAGGVAAYAYGKIINCTVSGKIEANYGEVSCAGGITGGNQGTSSLISKCMNMAEVVAGGPTNIYVSGISGFNYGLIEGCVNDGHVYADEWAATTVLIGGISCANDSIGTISGCSNTGTVERGNATAGTIMIGGITGRNFGTVQYCVNTDSSDDIGNE